MGTEIERRFLVAELSIVRELKGSDIVQGYLAKDAGGMSTRIRIADGEAWLTLKTPRNGAVRDEYEYPIPAADAARILAQHCGGRVVRKTRHRIPHAGHLFEVDVFAGPLSGLVIAEVELAAADEAVILPPWIGREITWDHRYGNAFLAQFGLPEALRASARGAIGCADEVLARPQ